MPAKKISCRLIETRWLTPSVMQIGFEPTKRFSFEPGQFLSVLIPTQVMPLKKGYHAIKRAYSFASSPECERYEICVKYVPGGKGGEYLKSLRPGDDFTVFAPYGDFVYRPKEGRSSCFIATGSGIGPFRSIVLSRLFQRNRPETATLLFGARTSDEILYRDVFESQGVETVIAISRPDDQWQGFKGRVTDYLRTLPSHWAWHTTDFYVCGNSEMALEVASILKQGHNVADSSIHLEVFSPGKRNRGGQEAA